MDWTGIAWALLSAAAFVAVGTAWAGLIVVFLVGDGA